MANKIVQLTDKGGDDIFPIAGGMSSDSITTAMIQDGAVTSDKIDFTTITSVSRSQNVLPSLKINYLELGDLIVVTMHSTGNDPAVSISGGQIISLGVTLPGVPVGSRLLAQAVIVNGSISFDNRSICVTVSSDGDLQLINVTTTATSIVRLDCSFVFQKS